MQPASHSFRSIFLCATRCRSKVSSDPILFRLPPVTLRLLQEHVVDGYARAASQRLVCGGRRRLAGERVSCGGSHPTLPDPPFTRPELISPSTLDVLRCSRTLLRPPPSGLLCALRAAPDRRGQARYPEGRVSQSACRQMGGNAWLPPQHRVALTRSQKRTPRTCFPHGASRPERRTHGTRRRRSSSELTWSRQPETSTGSLPPAAMSRPLTSSSRACGV